MASQAGYNQIDNWPQAISLPHKRRAGNIGIGELLAMLSTTVNMIVFGETRRFT